MMRVLGIDIGLKRTGLAVSDELGLAIKHLPNLKASSRLEALEKLLALVIELSVQAIVIGEPEARTTASKAISLRAQGLKVALEEALLSSGQKKVQVFLWDESLTSKKAMANLVLAQVPRKHRRALQDSASAAILVEEFLQAQKGC